MKAETPAKGILKTSDFGTCKFYHVHCECGSEECAHEVCVEADDMNVTVSIFVTLRTKWYEQSRWKQIWSVLTKGYIDSQSTLVLSEQVALNYAETLKTAIKDVKELRDERDKTKSD